MKLKKVCGKKLYVINCDHSSSKKMPPMKSWWNRLTLQFLKNLSDRVDLVLPIKGVLLEGIPRKLVVNHVVKCAFKRKLVHRRNPNLTDLIGYVTQEAVKWDTAALKQASVSQKATGRKKIQKRRPFARRASRVCAACEHTNHDTCCRCGSTNHYARGCQRGSTIPQNQANKRSPPPRYRECRLTMLQEPMFVSSVD